MESEGFGIYSNVQFLL